MRQHGTGRGRTEPIHMTGWTRTFRFPRQACRNERGAQGGSAVPSCHFEPVAVRQPMRCHEAEASATPQAR
jgi:hypothetical protein